MIGRSLSSAAAVLPAATVWESSSLQWRRESTSWPRQKDWAGKFPSTGSRKMFIHRKRVEVKTHSVCELLDFGTYITVNALSVQLRKEQSDGRYEET